MKDLRQGDPRETLSLLVVNSMGVLIQLNVPFNVICIENYKDLERGKTYEVMLVHLQTTNNLAFSIKNTKMFSYSISLFQIS